MVSDPRVTAYLSRLGGVYRDPARVDRDASSLLKSSVGTHLQPLIAEMVENDGTTSNVLVLQGTIAMHFRGNTYQLLVDLYLPSGYPSRPPVCFVRLAPNMYLKDNHRHVGMDGKVYLPYLHEWNRHSHNLVELVVAMSSVFSADPPVFSRPPKPASGSSTATGGTSSSNHRPVATSTTTGATTATTTTWTPTPPPPPPHLATGTLSASAAATSGTESDREAILLVEIAEANAAAEAARRAEALEAQQEAARKQAEREERQRQQALEAQKRYEQERLQQVRDQVEIKLRRHLLAQAQDCRQMLQNDLRDQQRLTLAQEQKVQRQLELYTHAKTVLETQCATVAEKTRAIQEWLEEVQQQKAAANGTDSKASERSIDDLVQPLNAWQAQMIDLAAENQAIADAMYFLDRALYKSGTSPSPSATSLDCESHLRQVRKLAKRQFLLRAHLLKIGQVAMMQNPTSMASV